VEPSLENQQLRRGGEIVDSYVLHGETDPPSYLHWVGDDIEAGHFGPASGRLDQRPEHPDYVPGTVEDWDVLDPADLPLEGVRLVRDEIQRRVAELLDTRLEDIRADKSAHQVRLAHLLPGLADEFEGHHPPEEIRACADAILAQFADVPVRSHVMTLAHRNARECLRHEICEPLAVA
jgi:hypothetical protein